jgi:hypothetical protein
VVHVSINLTTANLGRETLGVELCKMSSLSASPVLVAHPVRRPRTICCLHVCQIRSLNGRNLESLTARPPGRSHTRAEAAELAADQAEQRSRWADNHTARPGTPESEIEDVTVPNTPPLADDS